MRRALVAVGVLLATSTAEASTKQCVETGTVVGETQCTNFGAFWSTERSFPLFLGFGAVTSFAPSYNGSITDKAANTELATNSAALSRGALRAYGGELRLGGHFSPYTYMGLTFGFGLGTNASRTVESNGYRVSLGDGVNFLNARVGPLFGVRVPLGRVSLRGEIGTVLQLVSVQFKAIAPDGTEKTGSGGGAGIGIEPRIAIDFWPAPDTTISLWSGTNLIRPGDVTIGLGLTGHLRAFDGAFK